MAQQESTMIAQAQLQQENDRLQADKLCLRQEHEQLRKSQARYRQCFENAPISIQFIASDGRFVEVNQAYKRYFKIAIDWKQLSEIHELLSRGQAANFLVADLLEPARTIFTVQGNLSMLAVPIFVKGRLWGGIRFDNCKEARLYDEAEMAILQVAADSITAAIERQQQDEVLRESEKRYRTLFELSHEGIVRFGYEQPILIALPMEPRSPRCRSRSRRFFGSRHARSR